MDIPRSQDKKACMASGDTERYPSGISLSRDQAKSR